MKLCIPVSGNDGFESEIEPNLPAAQHLLFFDTETRPHVHISLCKPEQGDDEQIRMDAVLCGSIDRGTLRHLIGHGIEVYGTSARTVAQAVAQFENGELSAVAMPAGGCCSGQGHGRGEHDDTNKSGSNGEHACGGGGGGCGGWGCGGHEHGHEHGHHGGGCCGSHADSSDHSGLDVSNDVLRVAVCSQNRKTVTEHAGKCRKFWVYEIRQGQVSGRTLLELPIDQSFHEAAPGMAHPLDDVNVLISGGMGGGLKQRLLQRGIRGLVTAETDPDRAIAALLSGGIENLSPSTAWVSG